MKKMRGRISGMLAMLLASAVFLNNGNIYSAFAAGQEGAFNQAQPDERAETGDDEPFGAGAEENEQPGEGDEAGGEKQPGEGDEAGGEKQPGEGDETGGEKQPGEGDETGGEKQPGEGDETGGEKQPGEGDETGGEKQPGEEGETEENDQMNDDNQQPEVTIPDADDEEETEGDIVEIPLCLEGKEHEYEIIVDEEGENVVFRCVFCQREIDAETYEKEDAVLHEHVWSRPEGELIPLCETCSAQRLDCDGEEGYGIHIFELIQEEGVPDRYRCAICGEEKETLDEWDMTLEMFQEIWGISLYADIDMGELGTATIPADLSELERQINEEGIGKTIGSPIKIRSLADLMVLQDLSAQFDFAGLYVAFTYADTQSEQVWDLTKLSTVGYGGKYFVGIGTKEFPFKGILCSAYKNSYSYQTTTPLFNYLGTGATVEDMPIEVPIKAAITGNGTDPVGILARHVVKADESGIVNLNTVTVSGTVTNPGAAAGGLFGEITNVDGAEPIKIQYTNSNQLTFGEININAGNAGGMVGKTTGPVEIYLTDVFPKGTITGTDAAGMLAGSMEPGGALYIKGAEDGSAFSVNVKGSSENVKGSGVSGGLVGKTDQVEIIQDSQNQVIIAGNVEGGTAGGLFGECIATKVRLDHITISAETSVKASSQDAGGVIGRIQGTLTGSADLKSENWHQLHHITIEGKISGGQNAGGVVGRVEASNFRIGLPEKTADFECIQMAGTVSASNSAGGMIGAAKGQYIEVYHSSVSGGINGTEMVGGIFGNVESNDNGEHTVVKVSDVKVSSTMSADSDKKIYGGIFGQVQASSMAALDQKIDVDDLKFNISKNHDIYRGYIAGTQTEALIYFEESCTYKKPNRYDLSTYPDELPAGTVWVDDIGEYGGVYRNGKWGEDQNPLISYENKDVSGTVGSSADGWELDSEADIMRLAIMLNTEGNFAGGCFRNSSKPDLLKGNYLLTKSDKSEYALVDSGIYALNRNEKEKGLAEEQCFTGSFSGNGESRAVLNLGRCVTYQYNIALFPKAGDGAEFSNLEIKRDIFFAKGAAGLAVKASDNIKVENVDIEMKLNSSFRAIGFHYGGMFADYNAKAGTSLSVSDSRIGGKLKIYEGPRAADKQYLGGLIAKYESEATGTNLPKISINGLEIAAKMESDSRVVSGMITEMNAGSGVAEDKVILAMQEIHVKDGATLTITDADNTADTGGFLGRMWYGVVPYEDGAESYSIKGLKVGDNDTTKSPQYTSNGLFGGMVCTVRGRIQLQGTQINNLVITSKTDRNGLLFRNGHNALIELEGYQIAGSEVGADKTYPANGKVQVTGTTGNFSDIVGNNIVDENGYTSGGIVNIISPAFDDKFYSYSKHNLGGDDGGSRYTRYYYNLFGTSMSLQAERNYLKDKQLDSADVIIKDADQMMIWHLFQYMDSSIKRYLSPYFTDALPGAIDQITISGTIDLNHRSYYPTPVSGCTIKGVDNAKIIFYGDKIEQGVSEKRPRDDKENYMMHSGLLLSPAGTVTVQGDENFLTLSGKVSYVGQNSGALFSRSIGGNKSIYRIKLEDCYVCSYDGATHEVGLLIGAVNDGTAKAPTDVDISWIKTEGYPTGGDCAGSALIGRVGSSDAKNLKMDLTNIKIHDKTDTNGGIFKYASLIDYYQYTQSTEENNVRVRYLFTQEAYKGTDDRANTRKPFDDEIHGQNEYAKFGPGEAVFVTIGKELKDGVEYWNIDEVPADFLEDYEDRWEQYLPYVCKANSHVPASRDIRVNPKNTGILEGCGTYEDPYVIKSAKQILALTCYLSSSADGNKQTPEEDLKNWKIRPVGCKTDNIDNGTNICNRTHNESTLAEYGEEDFPTRDELRQAYYIIVEDLDFSYIGSADDNERARSFVGIGTKEIPFSGVIIGRKENGSIPKITLPYKAVVNNDDESPDNFGFIQYAQGAVVKNLEIIAPVESEDKKYTNVIRVGNMGSPVIACILGGDNIIDNVKTGGLFAVKSSAEGKDTAIGGYVGIVQQGSLILRNLNVDNFVEFKCGKLENRVQDMDLLTSEEVSSSYPYLSAAIGKVENGYVIYEDTGYSGSEIVLTHESKDISGVYTYNTLPFSNTYDVIRASGMKDQIGKIKITQTGNNFDCTIANAQQLQLVSMAINSDSFSVYYGGGGYNRLAVCRKARYDQVADIDPADPGEEYRNATGQDDKVYWYPYIYQYFDFSGLSNGYMDSLETDTESHYRSRLNAVTAEVSSVMTYHLQDDPSKDIDYDLSGYKRGFRGLGATYRVFTYTLGATNEEWISLVPAETVYSDFRANFDGDGATVKAEMINDYASEIHTTALFNDLVNTKDARNKNSSYTIENLVVTGTFISCFAQEGAAGTTTDAISYKEDRAAALVGMMLYPCKITKVTVKDVKVRSKGHAAGIVAWINPSELTSGSGIEFVISDSEVNGKSAIHTKGGSSGGIVGVMASQRGGMDKTGFSLKLEGCKVHGESNTAMLQISNDGESDGINSDIAGIYERYARGRSGAFIGYAGVRQDKGGTSHEFQVTIHGKGSGVDADADVEYVSINGAESTGGIIGEYTSSLASSADRISLHISDIVVSSSILTGKNANVDASAFGIGGIIGTLRRSVTCEVKNVKVIDTNIYSGYSINGAVSDAGISQGDLHAGGIVGSYYHQNENSSLTLTNVSVAGTLKDGGAQYEISSRLSDAGGIIGASVISGNAAGVVKITNAAVTGMNIQSDNRSQADKGADTASGSSKRSAGGMIGQAVRTNLNIQTATVDECTIRSGIGSSGGVIGSAGDGKASSVLDAVLNTVAVTNSTIGTNGKIAGMEENAGAGGIYGNLRGAENQGSQMLHAISVENCTLYGKNTGGIAGAVDTGQQIGNIWSGGSGIETQDGDIKVKKNQILGFTAGGVFGLDQSKKTCFEKVVVTENVILACGNSDYSAAGGFGGRKENSGDQDNDSHTLNSILVEKNRIFSNDSSNSEKQSAGGIFGYLKLTQEIYSDKAAVKNNHIGYHVISDDIKKAVSATEAIKGQMNVISGELKKLVSETASLWNGNGYVALPADLKEDAIGRYAAYFGNLVGSYAESGHAYFLEPVVIYDDANAATRPVVDVGSLEAVTTTGDKMLSDPYAYRENIHVIYFEPDVTDGNKAAGAWDGHMPSLGKDALFSQVNAEKELEEYNEALKSGADTKQVLNAYRLNITDDNGKDMQEVFRLVYQNQDKKYLSPFEINGQALPMIYIDMQYGTVEQLLPSVLAVLTNTGGVPNSGSTDRNESYDAGIGQIMELSVEPYQIVDGVISKREGAAVASVVIKGDEKRWEISAADRIYDTSKEDKRNGTFSLLTVVYSQDSYKTIDDQEEKDGEKIVLRIPVFVEERLTIDTHLKIVEAEAYNAGKAKEEGAYTKPILANDSSYTLYLEYIYGSARNRYSTDSEPLYVDKKLEMTAVNGNDIFWKGTRLTLIDVTDSDKVYYYTVTGDEEKEIPFTGFKDADGNSYQPKAVHNDEGKEIYTDDEIFVTKDIGVNGSGEEEYQYRNVAVEKFLIVADTSGVDKKLKIETQDIRGFHVTPELKIPENSSLGNIEERTTITEHTALNVTRQATLNIEFLKKGEEGGTNVTGSLQSGDQIIVDADFQIKGESLYWSRLFDDDATLIDSANSNKYLEVGIYLTDTNGNRVRIPDNTNVTVNGQRIEPVQEEIKKEENVGAFVNRTAAYFYKDGKIQFSMNELRKIMEEPYKQGKLSLEEKLKFVFDFSNADLSSYTDEHYQVHIELLRIDDKDYPAGGEVIDTHSDEVDAKIKSDLACALETKDLMDLGINTYRNITPMPHEINFDFMLDFNYILSDTNETWNKQQIEDKYFTVTYHILEKKIVNGVISYVPYTGEQMSLELLNPPDPSDLLQEGGSSVGELINSKYITYRFKLSEIKQGTGNAGKGVITRSLVLTVKDAAAMELSGLSNYKIQASVKVTDDPPEDIEKQVNSELSDFFIFTIANLKTDLDD